MKNFLCLIALLFFSATILEASNKIWFKQPATDWNEALPIGNGRLGGMVFGGTQSERIQLNEESVWTGSRSNFVDKPDAWKHLAEIRELLFAGEYVKAQEITENDLMGIGNWDMYQTLGDLTLVMGHGSNVENYTRELDLENAIARVSYLANGVNYTREYFSSA